MLSVQGYDRGLTLRLSSAPGSGESQGNPRIAHGFESW
jgi:hypothetical protein